MLAEIAKEEEKFAKTLEKGLREFDRMASGRAVTGEDAFVLFLDLWFSDGADPGALVKEKAGADSRRCVAFEAEPRSIRSFPAPSFRRRVQGRPCGTIRPRRRALHTATHLLQPRAQDRPLVLMRSRRGSNITERLRFDLFPIQKMTPEELQKVEDMVNDAIARDLPVRRDVHERQGSRGLGLFRGQVRPARRPDQGVHGGDDAKGYLRRSAVGRMEHGPGDLGRFKIRRSSRRVPHQGDGDGPRVGQRLDN